MTKGKHLAPKKKHAIFGRGTKSLTFIAAVVVLSVTVIGGAVAWLTTDTNPVVNTFNAVDIGCEVTETLSDTEKTSVKISNTGDADAYIRVAVVGNTIAEDGKITGAYDVSDKLNDGTKDWLKIGNYYYCTKAVASGSTTDELLSGAIDLSGKQVVILAEAIQASPADAVTEAWGVAVDDSGVITGAAA